MIKSVIEAANSAGVSVSVCGEMAGEPEYALILLGFGVGQLSMNAASILKVKRLIRSVNYADSKKICKGILGFATAADVENYINSKMPGLYREEFFS